MAAIDKIYGTKIESDVFRAWCSSYYPKALKYFYDWAEEWKSEDKHPITNFPQKMDMWLLNNCPIDFVVRSIKDQYGIYDIEPE